MLALDLLESLRLITLLKVGVGSLFLEECPLMEVWNGWAFLTFTGMMGTLVLLISLLPILVGETVVPQPIRTGEFNLRNLLELFPSRGIFPYLSFRFTTTGYRKICVTLRVTSVTTTFNAIIWSACTVSLPAVIPSEIDGLIGRMMIGRVRLINNFCGGSVGSFSISDFSFLYVTSVSIYQWIDFWIAFCVIFV